MTGVTAQILSYSALCSGSGVPGWAGILSLTFVVISWVGLPLAWWDSTLLEEHDTDKEQ